jgi:membrane protein
VKPSLATWRTCVWRSVQAFREHQLTDAAAALTYYAMLSLFPLLLACVSLFSLAGDPETVGDFVDYLTRHGANRETRDAVDAMMSNLVETSGGTAGTALVVSLALALNGASGAFAAAGRALNRVYEVEEDRGFIARKLTDLGITVIVVLLLLTVIASLFIGGEIAESLFGRIGLGSTAAAIWSVARWPLAVLLAMVTYALIYGTAADVTPRHIQWLSPGAIAGVVVWMVASLLFGIYVQNFGSYGAAYGAFGAALVLLLWLWVSSCAFLLGAELNVQLQRMATARQAASPNTDAGTSPAGPDTLRTAGDPAPASE